MLFPHTETRRVALRPAGPEDAPEAYQILFRLGTAGLPVLDTYTKNFGAGLSACFLVHRKDTGEVVGLGTVSDPTPAGHVRIEVHLAGPENAELAGEVHALTANFAFAMWRVRKVYIHRTSPDAGALGFGPDHSAMVRAEAVLPDHTYFHGRLWDVHIFAIHRDDWNAHGVALLKQIV
ncbi:GNAT family N-acetyltransferase [Streptomyces sp. RS10V-4]|uniref:GNAT family N-acetyltransferase n=1 Tax=Streptomyces rhizoryzae TaxID=2932493 RepID=UPI00200432EB|nr:GNAT family protein [Streptomyces rhizoryzae]MCK7624198.1 GNAT family N-acetyltransferase [Streptomyces rhizoryzae]